MCELSVNVTLDDVYKYTHRCDMGIKTDFQGIQRGGGGDMPLRADKLPISHNNVVGENTFLQIYILETHSWFRIHLQLDFVSLEMNSDPTRVRTKMFRWRTYKFQYIASG